MKNKQFLSISDQIACQNKRGLTITDPASFENRLVRGNYFNIINGFETLFLETTNSRKKQYMPNICVEDFEKAYQLDQIISTLLYKQLSCTELAFSSSLSYRLTEYQNAISPLSPSDNCFYLDIANYSRPQPNSAPDYLINYFYNTDSQGKVRNSHKFFKKHKKSNVEVVDITFTGTCRFDRGGSNKVFLKGIFDGRFSGVEDRNVYEGQFIFEKQLMRQVTFIDGHRYSNLKLDSSVVGDLISLNYADYCKLSYRYVASYEYPPLWVIINTLMLNDLIVLFLGLPSVVQNQVMSDLNFVANPSSRKEEFVTFLEVLRETRNTIAHYGLITRLRIPEKITINSNTVSRLGLKPEVKGAHKIGLWDVLKILNSVDVFDSKEILRHISEYLIDNFWNFKHMINHNFMNRIYRRKNFK